MLTSDSKGKWGEFFCFLYLSLKGYAILSRRFKTNQGEIDIIAKTRRAIIAVEVKTRKKMLADEIIKNKQKRRIIRTLALFIKRFPVYKDYDMRIDAVIVLPYRFPIHIKNAISMDDL